MECDGEGARRRGRERVNKNGQRERKRVRERAAMAVGKLSERRKELERERKRWIERRHEHAREGARTATGEGRREKGSYRCGNTTELVCVERAGEHDGQKGRTPTEYRQSNKRTNTRSTDDDRTT
jgi:hypothetical protein